MKKTTSQRTAVILLLSSLLLSAACGSAETPSGTQVSPDVTQTEPVTETEALPDLSPRDFGGKTFHILASHWGSYSPLDYVDIVVEEQNGDALNDAAFRRNTNMEEKYNCKVELTQVSGAAECLTRLQQTVQAGDDAYAVCFMRGTNIAAAITSGYLVDLSAMPHINPDKPWWDSSSLAALTVGDKNYAILGDTTTNHMNSVWTVCFNKKLIRDYKLEDPYELVESGKWTFDKAVEMSKTIARDLNGDSKMDANDLWGINHTNDTVIGILNACGVTLGQINDKGRAEITVDSARNVERIADIYTKLFNEQYAMDTLSRDVMKAKDSDGDYFKEDKVLFLFTATHLVWQLRQMEVDFGMLPYPKYTENEDYHSSTAGIFLSLTTVPASNQNLDDTGYFLEAYAYEGWKLLRPAFYENVLKGKLARDTESESVLDTLYGSLSYDAGNIFNFGNLTSNLANMSKTRDTNITSFLASNLPAVKEAAAKFNGD